MKLLATCPSQKLHPAIVPADRTHVELGDDRENGHEEAWNPARMRLFHRHRRTGNGEPARQAGKPMFTIRQHASIGDAIR